LYFVLLAALQSAKQLMKAGTYLELVLLSGGDSSRVSRVDEHLTRGLGELLDDGLLLQDHGQLGPCVHVRGANLLLELLLGGEALAAERLGGPAKGGAMELGRHLHDAHVGAGLLRRLLEDGVEVREEDVVREVVEGEVRVVAVLCELERVGALAGDAPEHVEPVKLGGELLRNPKKRESGAGSALLLQGMHDWVYLLCDLVEVLSVHVDVVDLADVVVAVCA
jgi:hypothetical protein